MVRSASCTQLCNEAVPDEVRFVIEWGDQTRRVLSPRWEFACVANGGIVRSFRLVRYGQSQGNRWYMRNSEVVVNAFTQCKAGEDGVDLKCLGGVFF